MRRRPVVEKLDLATGERRALSAWRGADVAAAADLARQEFWGKGTCLVPVATLGAVVVPVVSWHPAALSRRLESGMGAVLDLVTLRDRLDEGVDPESAPLQVVGWVVVSAISQSWDAMARLSPFGPVVSCVPGIPQTWTLMECDVFGYSVASMRDGALEVLVRGHSGPRPGTSPMELSVRSRQEQLFDVFLRSGDGAHTDPVTFRPAGP